MMAFFADIDWQTIGGSAVAALGMVGGGLTAIGKVVLAHLKVQAAEQHTHESEMMARMEAITAKFDATVREMQISQRTDSRETITTLLGIQRETVEAVNNLGKRVSDLGGAITELRGEVARKQDRTAGGH